MIFPEAEPNGMAKSAFWTCTAVCAMTEPVAHSKSSAITTLSIFIFSSLPKLRFITHNPGHEPLLREIFIPSFIISESIHTESRIFQNGRKILQKPQDGSLWMGIGHLASYPICVLLWGMSDTMAHGEGLDGGSHPALDHG